MREDAINGTFDVKQVDTSLCLQALRPAVTSHHAQNIVVQPVAWTQNQREEVRLLGDKVGAIALPGTHQTNYIAEPKVYENHAQDSRVTGPLEVAPTVAAKFGTGGGNVPLVGAMAVRRLTPVETERLQGFPDNWSRISWKGKPETECPDGPRYKACGNSMAVPVMRWIGERIAAVDSTLPPHA
jgi:DNA (cytosine-5)-methyltransferase 1